MSQTSVSSYFNNRKRPIDDDTILNKNKVICLDRVETLSFNNSNYGPSETKVVFQNAAGQSKLRSSVRQGISSQRVTRSKRISKDEASKVEKSLNLSPQKKLTVVKLPTENKTPVKISKDDSSKHEVSSKTPSKELIPTVGPASPAMSRGQLLAKIGVEEMRKKLQNSSRLAELKTKLNSIQCGLDRVEQLEKRNVSLPKLVPKKNQIEESPKKSLRTFNNIELEIIRFVFKWLCNY